MDVRLGRERRKRDDPDEEMKIWMLGLIGRWRMLKVLIWNVVRLVMIDSFRGIRFRLMASFLLHGMSLYLLIYVHKINRKVSHSNSSEN